MHDMAERLLALDRALDDVRFAERLLIGRLELGWRGPAGDTFARAGVELPLLLRAATAALERERSRTLLLTRVQ